MHQDFYNSFQGSFYFKITVTDDRYVRIYGNKEENRHGELTKNYDNLLENFTIQRMFGYHSFLFHLEGNKNEYVLIHNFAILKFTADDEIINFSNYCVNSAFIECFASDKSHNVYIFNDCAKLQNVSVENRWRPVTEWWANELDIIAKVCKPGWAKGKKYGSIEGYTTEYIDRNNKLQIMDHPIGVWFGEQLDRVFEDSDDDPKIKGSNTPFTKELYIQIRDEYCAKHGIQELKIEKLIDWA